MHALVLPFLLLAAPAAAQDFEIGRPTRPQRHVQNGIGTIPGLQDDRILLVDAVCADPASCVHGGRCPEDHRRQRHQIDPRIEQHTSTQ